MPAECQSPCPSPRTATAASPAASDTHAYRVTTMRLRPAYAVPEVSHAFVRLDRHLVEHDGRAPELREERRTTAEQDRDQVEPHLVDQVRVEGLRSDRAAVQADDLVAGEFTRLRHGVLDSGGHEVEARVRPVHRRAVREHHD